MDATGDENLKLARGKKPQPLKFLCSVVEQGHTSEHLAVRPAETGQQDDRSLLSVFPFQLCVCDSLPACSDVGGERGMTLLCRALSTSLSPGVGGPWRSDITEDGALEPFITSS